LTTILLLALLLALSCGTKGPDPVDAGEITVDQPLPVDPGVRQGTLDNGLTWYVEENARPESRAELRLVVKAGSVLEDEDQLGLAHFVEHMAFNGTENFPANSLVEYLESTGTKFGAHLNAYTSFDRTVYQLRVPTDDPALFDKSFTVLADWAGGITFADEEIDKERGVVLEEWRRRLGPGQRLSDLTRPLVYGDSRYTTRLPIGTGESLETFEADAARRFYADWYRPDLMAVIAVGDFESDEVIAQIESTFGALANPEEPRPRDIDRISNHAETRYGLFEDPEITRTTLQLLVHQDMPQDETYGDYRQTLLHQLVNSVLNERMADLARQPDAPFLGAGAGEARFNLYEGAQTFSAGPREGEAVATYRVMLTELKRLKDHGIRASELERAQSNMLRRYEDLLVEKDKTDSRSHAQEIVRVFAENEAMPGIDAEVAAARAFVPEFTVEEITSYVASEDFFPPYNRVVLLSQPQKEGLRLPSSTELLAVESAVRHSEIEALPEEAEIGPLLTSLPEPGKIVATDKSHAKTLGFRVHTLSNGVDVWFRDTDFQEDQIIIRGFSNGGHSWIDDDVYVDAAFALRIQALSGLGAHDASALRRWSAGRTFSVRSSINEFTESMGGTSSAADLEAAMQMIYASVVSPQLTEDGFNQVLAQQTEAIRNRDANPNAAFADAWSQLVYPDDPRAQPWTLDRLAELDLATARQQYEAHVGHATDFDFVFVGNLPDDFDDLVERYLASLPTNPADQGWVDRGVRPKSGQLSTTVRKGLDDKARVRMTWYTEMDEVGWLTRNHYYSMTDILAVHLRRDLREERGGVYGVSVSPSTTERPVKRAATTIRFTCDPARVDELIAAVEAGVARLKQDGPDPQDVLDEQAKNRRERETRLETNGFWASAITGALRRGEDPEKTLDWDARNDALSVETVKAMANRVFGENRALAVLLPEEAQTASRE